MKKLALCALVLSAGLAASRADVSLGIRIGIDDHHDRQAERRSSHSYNHYPVQQRRYVLPPATAVRYETVVVTCPVTGRPMVEQRPVYQQYAAYPPTEMCADRRPYTVVQPVCPPRGRGW